ncbi:MAG: tetratricopeptide repeat protein [Armatimonadota bacterium]
MKRSLGNKLIAWLLVVCGLLLVTPLQNVITRERLLRRYNEPTPIAQILEFNPLAITGVIAGMILGGFRGTAANFMWIKMDQYWNSERWHDCLYVMRAVTWLDPHFIDAWKTTSWHLMYNMTVETEVEAKRQQYLREGIDVLKEGISWNPEVPDLYVELGWNYFDKMDDFDEAARWFGYALRFQHPDYVERLLAHGYERKPDIERALDWYDYCLKRYPFDNTAIGATVTIRERYLEAWRLLEAGQYEQARDLMVAFLTTDPTDTIGNRILATIYERQSEATADPERARALKEKAQRQWEFLARSYALDSYAERKALALRAELGMAETPEELRKRLARERRDSLMERDKGLYTEREHETPTPGR